MRRSRVIGLADDLEKIAVLPLRVSAGIAPDFPHSRAF
jgi:hypothetical protein